MRMTIPANPCRGQVLLVVLFSVMVLVFAVLWLADIHHLVRAKDKTQNAGDAAALEAARWQGIGLNLEGELNLLAAMATAFGDSAAVEAITNTQTRVQFAVPMTGAYAAQQAAKLNGAPDNEAFVRFVRDCAASVRHEYGAIIGGTAALTPPWEGAWDEYAEMLDALAGTGMPAGIDNALFYFESGGNHILLESGFYRAVLGRDWCWFYRNGMSLLEDYTDYRWWSGLPGVADRAPASCEFLGLGLRPFSLRIRQFLSMPDLDGSLAAEDLPDVEALLEENERRARREAGAAVGYEDAIDEEIRNPVCSFVIYEPYRWAAWDVMTDPAFPIDGDLKPEYDYWGADAAIRVENTVDRLTQRADGSQALEDMMVWTAAAKPFGFLKTEEGKRVPPTYLPIVLPVFTDVRLIPYDACSTRGDGSFNLNWIHHCREHLPGYMDRGPDACVAGCRYCNALRRWEPLEFRENGIRWLVKNNWKCTVVPGPGPGSSGGSRHAH